MNKDNDLLFIEDFNGLFVDIQTRKVLADQKTFVDSEPKRSLKAINEAYHEERLKKDFDLAAFYRSNFDLPRQPEKIVLQQAFHSVEEYIECLWDALTRYPEQSNSTLIPLPGKFIVPGGRFREIFYWDSYFTMLGLQVAKRIDLMESMVDNFAYLIHRFGFVPNANRTYFLSRSQPPFFSLMVELLSKEKGAQVYTRYLSALEKEYFFWMNGSDQLSEDNIFQGHTVLMKDGEILNRYWDALNTPRPEGYVEDLETAASAADGNPDIFRHLRAGAESGWDFSSRWFKDGKHLHTIHTADIAALDLNCLLFHLEETLAKSYQLAGHSDEEVAYSKKAADRKIAIQKYLWNNELQCFDDFDRKTNQCSGVLTAAMAFPLFFQLASAAQAKAVMEKLGKDFLQTGGLLTTLTVSGQQWDAPNGWAPLQWMAFLGALNYGYDEFARQLKDNWVQTIDTGFSNTGVLMEKYDVVAPGLNAGGGEYPNQYGFGWTNGVYLKIKSVRC